MRRIRLTPSAFALTLAVLIGCSDGILPPRVQFSDAIAMPGCGPADGGAVSIFLTGQPTSDAPSPPYLRVDIWRSLSELNNQSFSLEPGSQDAFASYFTSASSPTQVAGGTVSITSASTENGVKGELAAVIPDHGVISGGFTARWVPTRTMLDLCG